VGKENDNGPAGEDPPKRSKEYIANDFSIFNKYADGLIARDGLYTRFRWNEVWQSRLKIAIFSLIALLIVVAILFLVWKLIDEEPIISGVGVSTTTQPQIQYIPIPVPDPNLSEVIEKQIIIEVPKYIPIEIPGGKDVVTNFTLFRKKYETGLPHITRVITGLEFASSEDTFPIKQWCYANGEKQVGNAPVRIDIGRVAGTEELNWDSITQSQANEAGISEQTFVQLKSLCLFMAPGDDFVEDAPVGDAEDLEPTPMLSSGTGFAVNTKGFILTNEHVISECDTLKVLVNDELYDARVIAQDAQLDLAVVRTSSRVTKSSFIFAESVRTGESAITLGYPLFVELGVSLKVTSGIVSSLTGFRGDPTSLQFSAPIQPGNSGGPLVNDRNEVLAVSTSALTGENVTNVGFAIKGAQAQKFLAQNRIKFDAGTNSENLSIPEIVEKAEQAVFLILCKRSDG
jgi:S1-C subfamily serine protease